MFWENFVKLCASRNTKPNPVAAKLGISSGSVTKWKNGAKPNDTTLQKIADYFGVSVDFLLGKETDRPAGVPDAMWAELCKDEKRKALAMWIMSLPDDDLDRAEKLLDAAKLFPPDHS